MRSFASFGFLVFIVAFLITRSFILSICAVIIVKFFMGGSQSFSNREEARNLDAIQIESFSALLAYLLKETHHTSRREINTGKDAIRSIIQQTFPDFVNSPKEEEVLRNFEDYCTHKEIEAQVHAERLHQTFLYSTSRLSSSHFLQFLVISYVSIKGDKNVEERFVHTLMQIAASVGANNIIAGIILARFTNYQSQFNSFNSFFGFEQEQSQYQGYSNYRNNSGGSRSGGGGYSYGSESPRDSFRKACEFLGVSEDVNARELKSRRRKLLNQWHPDKAPPGKQEEYNKKSQEINHHADIIEAYKGF